MAILTTGAHESGLGSRYQSAGLLDYILKELVEEPPAFGAIRERLASQGYPLINIGPLEGKILSFLVHAVKAKKAVEIGTLGGYSGSWIASALPASGKLYSFEYDPAFAQNAQKNFASAGLAKKVQVILGEAAKTLKSIESKGPFDFCFIDADKINYPVYLRWAIRHVRSGGIVVGDNAFLFGKLHFTPERAGEDAPGVPAMREFLKLLADTRYFSSCAMIPTGEGMTVGIRK